MKTKFAAVVSLLIICFLLLNSSSCSSREETVSCFPKTPVNVVLNLNLPAYQNLQNASGWLYVNEQQAGTRGLIIVRSANGFLIFDRNAPHLCPDANTTLEVENNIKITCPKDGAEWILFSGEPTKIAQVSPKKYDYTFDSRSNILSVYY